MSVWPYNSPSVWDREHSKKQGPHLRRQWGWVSFILMLLFQIDQGEDRLGSQGYLFFFPNVQFPLMTPILPEGQVQAARRWQEMFT